MVKCPGCGEDNPPKFRLCGYCGVSLAGAAPVVALPVHEVRKTVTVLFSDLVGSTALGEHLDPEALREVMERYFSAMTAEITRHGGKVEKFIGDAIMAVFGLPRAHEDDALRAVRAAAGMAAALLALNETLRPRYGVVLANRTGVNTGEVVATDDPAASQTLVTGDAVNVAARLEQAAPANQVYLGATTYALVRDAVEVEAVEPLVLKGKAERVTAWRLVSALGQDGRARRRDTPIVGRDAELAVLDGAFAEACAASATRLVTAIGDAGVGKSRLVHEFVERLAGRARVLRGRCLHYGDGITFWPLREIVVEAAGIGGGDTPEVAAARLLALVDDADVANRIASATGLSAVAFPLPELYWAVRRLFEILAMGHPVVALIDDIHWAQPAFLDLFDHLLDTGCAVPVLLLATARHDLLEDRPDWGERAGSTRLVLEPLDDAAAAEVVAHLLGSAALPSDVIGRIVAAAEGNPLFVEQMLSMLIDTRALRQQDGQWVRGERYAEISVPPTIQALLEARLDRLGRSERAVVEPAAVIGLQFPQPAVAALAPEGARPGIAEHLGALTRKQFVQPIASNDADPVFRFHHHLVRETVYGGLLKRARASLHIDFVRWADRANAEHGRALEYEEILGYHLEQAHRYLAELGALDAAGHAIGTDGARRLGAAARRAFARGDMQAAASLNRRAVALLAVADAGRSPLLRELGEALMELGDFAGAREVLGQAVEAAEAAGDARARVSAQLVGMLVRLYSAESGEWGEPTLELARAAIAVLEGVPGSDNELAMAWRLISFVHGVAGRYRQLAEPLAQWVKYARLAANDRLIARSSLSLSVSALLGPTPVAEAIAECEQIVAGGLVDRQVESRVQCTLAQLHAMRGEFETARRLVRDGRALMRELGRGVGAAATGNDLAQVELLAGDLAAAEAEVRLDYEFLAGRGETYNLATMAALLSRLVRDQGRDAEALVYSLAAEAAASADDVETQALWRSIRAPIVARAGDVAGAVEMARAAVALAQQTEIPTLQADALAELGAVLLAAGEPTPAAQALGEAIALYDAKGDVVSAQRARSRLGLPTGSPAG